ncbi:glycosyltransferase family 4 protein [Bacillota bacterium LX-D]|nr:glycosyltransferase family 4 protein [Bacillota bacterium LX-D]
MNIAFFSDSYRPYTSGVVQSIETFRSEFHSLGHNVYIFAPNYPNCKKEKAVFRFMSIPAPTLHDFTLAIPIAPSLGRTVEDLKIDVIHVHSPFLLGRLGAKTAKKHNIPLVYTYHTLYDHYVHYLPIAQNLTRWVVRKVSKEFCNNCDLVITPTKAVQNVLMQYGVNSQIRTVPTGINLKEYGCGDHNWLQATYGILPKDLILLFVGRLAQEKNLEFLLRAFQIILRSCTNTTLVLVGGGPQESYFRQLCSKLQIDKKVVFTGSLSHKQVINAYLSADIFVFSSVTETQGLVLGEAKAAGLPVVAVEAFGTKEMVGHEIDGFLTPMDLNIFSHSIIRLLRQPELRLKFGNNAKHTVQNISSNYSAECLLGYYNQILNYKNRAVS